MLLFYLRCYTSGFYSFRWLGDTCATFHRHKGKNCIDTIEQWLKIVDVGYSVPLALAAANTEPVRFFGRISANGANAQQEGGGFNIYFKYQGISDDLVVAALKERVEGGTMHRYH
jgi:hypothetical protein